MEVPVQSRDNRKTRTSASLCLGILAVVLMGFYIWFKRDEFLAVSVLSWNSLLVVMLGIGIAGISTGLINYTMLRFLGVGIGFQVCFFLSVVTSAGNLIGPLRSGTILRAGYLRQKFGFQLTHFVSTLFAFYLVMIITYATAALGLLLWHKQKFSPEGSGLIIAVLIICIGASLLFGLLPPIKRRGSWFLRKVSDVSDAWHVLRSTPSFLPWMAALSGVHLISAVITLWGAFRAIGVELGLAQAIIVSTLGQLSTLISITPGSFGIYETVVAFVGQVMQVEPVQSVSAALIMRGANLVFLAVFTPLATYRISRLAGIRDREKRIGRE
ncbi:MAG: flippase-like domain-containing protein [Deltaproteobacteria bacterium]|nr:flippase-like domain-containing protein [Deltaproteobacteria bacterium]MBW1816711.1 flippase-like domain-containing protein [Deltaproteobacteria bacterium]MBW2283378.1 flippase-like domain-containing protein [Deltaproteobacteria bacterium]